MEKRLKAALLLKDPENATLVAVLERLTVQYQAQMKLIQASVDALRGQIEVVKQSKPKEVVKIVEQPIYNETVKEVTKVVNQPVKNIKGDPGKDAVLPDIAAMIADQMPEIPSPVKIIEEVIPNMAAFGEEYRDALELLPEGERLDIEYIDGWETEKKELTDEMRRIKQMRRGGGGGATRGYVDQAIAALSGGATILNVTGGGSVTVPAWTPGAIYAIRDETYTADTVPVTITATGADTLGNSTDPLSVTTEGGWYRLIANNQVANDWFIEG